MYVSWSQRDSEHAQYEQPSLAHLDHFAIAEQALCCTPSLHYCVLYASNEYHVFEARGDGNNSGNPNTLVEIRGDEADAIVYNSIFFQ